MYLFFGAVTTAVSFFSLILFADFFAWEVNFSNVLSIFLGILVAYITNRSFVFKSEAKTIRELTFETFNFFASRAAVSLLDIGLMYLFYEELRFNYKIVKLFALIIVVILNYIISKFFIFKKSKEPNN